MLQKLEGVSKRLCNFSMWDKWENIIGGNEGKQFACSSTNSGRPYSLRPSQGGGGCQNV